MPKLSSLKPRLGSVPPLIGYQTGDERSRDKHRASTQHWRPWYNTAEWRKLRWKVLVRDCFTCQMCGCVEPDTSQLVGDHRIPHRGDRAKFFDETNVWCICKTCHDSTKQAEEQSSLHQRGVWY